MRLAAAAVAACGFLLLDHPVSAAAPGRLGGGETLDVSLWRIVLALLVCILVAVLAIMVVRQRSGRADLRTLFARFEVKPRTIEVVETRRLSQNADICLVRHGGREYLLLLLAGAARVLSEEPVADEAGREAEAR